MQLSTALQSIFDAQTSAAWAQVDCAAQTVQATHELLPSQPPVPEARLVTTTTLLDCASPVVAPP